MLVSLVVIIFFVFGLFFMEQESIVPLPAVIVAGATLVATFVGYLAFKEKHLSLGATVSYIFGLFTVAILVVLTAGTNSPFIALMLFLLLFVRLFGISFLVITTVLVNALIVLEHIHPNVDLAHLLQSLLIFNAPIGASMLLWRGSTGSHKEDEKILKLTSELSEASHKAEVVINSIDDGVVAIDSSETIQLINPAAQNILGWPEDEALSLSHKSVIKLSHENGDAVPDQASPLTTVLKQGKSITTSDLQLITRTGKKIAISLVVSPIGDGAPASGAIAVFRDITEAKEQERQKSEFVSTASHEMRTPVAAIEGYLSLALNPKTAQIDEKAHQYLTKAYESTQHLGRLFQDLLTVSRADDSRLQVRPIAIDVTAFTGNVVEALTVKAHDKGLELKFMQNSSQSGDTRNITPVYFTYFDADHLREVLDNLIENAIKYTNEGSVSVDIKGTQNDVIIRISDTGIGVPPEDVPHLFEKFYRVDNSATRTIGGTGLGLYICRRLMEANNGSISVTTTYGKGTTMQIKLPRLSPERAQELLSSARAQAV